MQKLQENLIVFPHYTLYIADTLCNIIAFVISLLNDIIILETPLNGHFIIALCKYVTTFLSRLYNVLFDLRFTQIVSLLRIILALIQYLWIKNKNFPVGETGFQSFSIHRVPVSTNQCPFVSILYTVQHPRAGNRCACLQLFTLHTVLHLWDTLVCLMHEPCSLFPAVLRTSPPCYTRRPMLVPTVVGSAYLKGVVLR